MNTINTLFIIIAITTSLSLGAEVEFSYDPTSDVGPDNWGTLDVEDNQCDGMSQSGINVVTGQCDEFNANYTFTVRVYFVLYCFFFVSFLSGSIEPKY